MNNNNSTKQKKYPELTDNVALRPLATTELSIAYKNGKVLSQSAIDLFNVEDKSTHYDIFPKGDPEWMKLTESLLAPAELALELKQRALLEMDTDETAFFSQQQLTTTAKRVRSRYDINDWNLLIRAQTAQSKFELAQQTFDKVCNELSMIGVVPNAVTFTAIIHACALCGGENAHSLAYDYFKQMKLMNVEPSIGTYGALVHAFTNANKIDQAFELIEAMRSRDIEPNNVIHSTVLAACVRTGDLTRAWQHYELMSSKYAIKPDEVSLSIMMHAAARAGQGERALRIFRHFSQLMLSPTKVTYHTLMTALAKRKDLRWKVFETADQMEANGHTPTIYTFNILCYACAKDGAIEKIPRILSKLQNMNLQPDSYTFTSLISAFKTANVKNRPETHNQNITDALAMFDLMISDGIEITIHTLNATLGVLATAMRINRALEFFETKYEQHGIARDAVTYTTMITMYVRAKKLHEAERMFMKFRSEHASQKPTYAMYKQIVLGYARSGETEKSTKWLKEMFSVDGFKLNPMDMVLYQSTVRGADNVRRNNVEKLKDIQSNVDSFLKVF